MAHRRKVGATTIALFTCAFLHSSAAQEFRGLDGTWEGSLTAVQGPGWYFRQNGQPSWTRLVISGTSAHVYQRNDNNTVEIKPGKFVVERVRTNAVIFALDTGQNSAGTWVQTMLYAITEKDQSTLIVNFYGVVNNLNEPLSNSTSKLTAASTGEFKRER